MTEANTAEAEAGQAINEWLEAKLAVLLSEGVQKKEIQVEVHPGASHDRLVMLVNGVSRYELRCIRTVGQA